MMNRGCQTLAYACQLIGTPALIEVVPSYRVAKPTDAVSAAATTAGCEMQNERGRKKTHARLRAHDALIIKSMRSFTIFTNP